MVISVIQFKTGDAEDIREKGLSLIERALKNSPDFILLQELFTTIYFPQYINDDFFKLAEELPGSLTDRIGGLIKNADVTVIVPVFERSAPTTVPRESSDSVQLPGGSGGRRVSGRALAAAGPGDESVIQFRFRGGFTRRHSVFLPFADAVLRADSSLVSRS